MKVTEAREEVSLLKKMYPGMYQMTARYREARKIIDNHIPKKRKRK